MPNCIYKVYFVDGTVYNGGSCIKDSKWKEIPDLPIKRLEYFVSPGEGIILEDFEEYFCFVEATNNFMAPIGNCPKCGNKAKLSRHIIGKKSKIISRCTNMGFIYKKDLEDFNIKWDSFIDSFSKNKIIIKVDDTKVMFLVNKKSIDHKNNDLVKNILGLIKEECCWKGEVSEVDNKILGTKDRYIYIMGRKGDKVTSYRVSLQGNPGESKYCKGDFTKRVLPLGKEYRGRPTNYAFWKKGI